MSSIKVTVTDSNNVNLTVNPRGSQTTAVSSNDIIVTVSPRGNQTVIIDRGVTSGGGGGGSGTVTQVTANTPLSVTNGTTTPDLSIAQATTSTSGYLSSTDWNTFNNKVGLITSTDGSITVTGTTTSDLSVASSPNVVVQVRNNTGATLTKGTAVYINGAIGQLPTVTKAQANSDAASAQTLGLMTTDLSDNANGYVTIIGLITNINTSAYTDGQQLYLSPTVAGGLTATKPVAPQHLVYVAVVEHAHITQGKLFVKVQNGYELDELHDVLITSPTDKQLLTYEASSGLWKNKGLESPPPIGQTTPNNITGTLIYGTQQVSSPLGIYLNYVQSPYFQTFSGGATPAIGRLGNISGFSPCGLELNDSDSGNYTLQIDPNNGFYGGAKYVTTGYCHDFNSQIIAPTIELNNGSDYVDIYPATGSGWVLTLPPTSGSNNQILKTDGSGNLDWMDLGSPPAIGGTTPNTITGTTVTAKTQITMPGVTVGNPGTGVLQMVDGLDGYDYLNIWSDDGAGSSYQVKFPYGLSTSSIIDLVNLSASGTISGSSFIGNSITLNGTFATTTIQPSNSALTTQTFTLPSSTGSANQVLKTDGSGNLSWSTQGVQGTAPVTVTAATYTVAATDQWIIGNRAGTITLTLPTASTNTGRSLTVKTIQSTQTVVSASSNVVPLAGGAAGTAILGTLPPAGKFATLVSDGTNWIIMQAG